MHLKLLSSRTTRWGATAAVAAMAIGVPSLPARADTPPMNSANQTGSNDA
ncbi:MAG: hypothetical protein QOE58_2382, partial [Actinomycetota bacterium]|nr:hypothetical protein [Actinomycetota bacterium]